MRFNRAWLASATVATVCVAGCSGSNRATGAAVGAAGAGTGGTVSAGGSTDGGLTGGSGGSGNTGGELAGGAGAGGGSAGSRGSGDAGEANRGQALAWVWTDYANVLTELHGTKSFTTISPDLYQINYDYASGVAHFLGDHGNSDSFSGLTSAQIAQKAHADGLKCTPLVGGGASNNGVDQGIINILTDSPSGATNSFITSMVGEAVSKGYDGYNLDWEVNTSAGTDDRYAAQLENFLAAFKAALHQHRMTLSIDLGGWYIKQSYCSGGSGFVDLTQLAPNVDLAILMDYTNTLGTASSACPSSIPDPQLCSNDFVKTLNLMCAYLPASVMSVGFYATPTGSNPIAGQALSTVKSYGIRNVAIWPDYNTSGPSGSYMFLDPSGIRPSGSTWPQLFAQFLSQP